MYYTNVYWCVHHHHPTCLYLCLHVEGKVTVNGPLRSVPIKATSSGEVPGWCTWRCTLERVLADVRARKCVHICMPYSMFVWEAMMVVYIWSTCLFIWQQQVYYGILCDRHNGTYNVRMYTASCVTCGEILNIYVLLLEVHGVILVVQMWPV